MQHLVIIGGGIAGLATAYYTQKQARAAGLDLKITLIEKNEGLGGKITTETPDGFVIEGGPDSFITQKPYAMQLCKELGIEDQMIGTNDDRRKTYILRNGRLHEMPDGLMLIVPTKFLPFVKSRLISWRGKIRMGMDLFIKARQSDEDESIAQFMRRRLGQEALEVLGEPMLAGIHVSDAETLSLKASFPRFHDIEKKYGSMTKGMIAARQQSAESKNKLPMFMTMRGGLQNLVKALVENFEGEILTGLAVSSLKKVEQGYQIRLEDGTGFDADTVILATPSYIAANLVQHQHPALADLLHSIKYVSTATISLGYRNSDFKHPLDGFGFVIPRTEPTNLLACTWTSTKFDHRAPEDSVLLRVFIGGPRKQELVEQDDNTLIQMVRDELRKIMKVDAEPTVTRVFRWRNANPQYEVGHLDRVDQLEALLPSGLYLTGSPYRGVGIPDCVHQGQNTAQKAIAHLLTYETLPSPT